MTLSCRMAFALAAAMLAAPALAQPEEAFTRQAGDPALEWGDCPGFMPEGCGLAVLQGDPGQRNADVFFRLPGGATAIRHWHSSAERMVLVAGQMRVETDGQDAVILDTGDYAYMPARLPHSAECVSDEACVLFIAFEDPVDAIEGGPD